MAASTLTSSLRSRRWLPVLLRWLQQEQPDIACLQELKAPQERFPAEAIRALGYNAVWHGQSSWNGVAILARDAEVHEIQRGLPGDLDDPHSRYIEAAVSGIVIASLYLPNGLPAGTARRPATVRAHRRRARSA